MNNVAPDRMIDAGCVVVFDEQDLGVVRAYRAGRLVGLVVSRNGDVTYAEFDGVVFPFHKTGNYRAELRDLYSTIKESAT